MAEFLPPLLHDHMTNGQSGLSALPSNVAAQASSKRPKLSLQTASLSTTYGSLTRGLSHNAAHTTYTPTTANTITNTWDLSIKPSPVLRTESPRPTKSQTSQHPYSLSLPFGVRSILKNSPIDVRQPSVSASPKDSRRKIFFPQPKKVVFSRNLEEVIETKKYTARHYDLSSSDENESGDEHVSSSSPRAIDENTIGLHSPPPSLKRKNRRDSGICISAPSTDEKATSQRITSSTTTRTFKRRKWQWTLKSTDSTATVESSHAINEDEPICSHSTRDKRDKEPLSNEEAPKDGAELTRISSQERPRGDGVGPRHNHRETLIPSGSDARPPDLATI